MATLRDIRRRIRSVESTQHITKAMEMVAAAKLRKAQDRLLGSRPYEIAFDHILDKLLSDVEELRHPLVEKRERESPIAVLLIAADRGLCGAFNSNLMRYVEKYAASIGRDRIRLMVVGRKGRDYFRKRGWPILYEQVLLPDDLGQAEVRQIFAEVSKQFLDGEVDEVRLIFAHFISATRRAIVNRSFLPLSPAREELDMRAIRVEEAPTCVLPEDRTPALPPEGEEPGTAPREVMWTPVVTVPPRDIGYILEPPAEVMLGDLLPRYGSLKLLMALRESLASEYSARMTAMSLATKNAEEMIDHLTLVRNKARQAMITKEISEIVGGASAIA